jgi:uracil-DNA glycosylase family 4
MNAISAEVLSSAELLQLMHFYADAGVDWLLEDEPQDRFAEFAALEAARARPAPPVFAEPAETKRELSTKNNARPAPPPPRTPVAIPDAEAVAEAQRIAASANTLDELAAAVASFAGCNLRNSARSTVFISGNPAARIAVAAGMPSSEDDREGVPFSGPAGAMLAKMLAGIGLSTDDVLLFNLIPWRPPGNRPPTPAELDICRPFGMRLIELLRPQSLLVLGNLPAKILSNSGESIHAQRGRWIDVTVNGLSVPAMATFHPQDLTAAPPCKRLAWQDLLAFRASLTN